jgi:hypothetical protein
MKKFNLCGWAVIFTVTLLLAACATPTSKVANTAMMSGPDATITQPEAQKQTLERRQNEMVIRQAWLDEREMRLDNRESFLDRRENALAINQAWLDERETRLAQGVPDLTQQQEILAFKEAWLDEREMLVEQMETRAASPVKLAGTDTSPVIAETPRTKVEAGRCYATVVYPAEYKTVAVTKPIEVPKGENLPVLYKTVTEKVKVTDEQMRWTEVLCDTDLSECRVSEIQRALSRGGYHPGPIDGIVGRQTMAAVNAFQKDFNLAVADYLTIETVRALDANF